jgi:hypothetical protein
LQALGVNMGERFREVDEFNPDGYCEDLDFKELNQSILKAAGGTWHEPPVQKELNEVCYHFIGRIQELVVRKCEARVWGFKDPRTCLTYGCIRYWLHNNCDVRIVAVRRNVDDVVKSVTHREVVRERRDDRPPMYWKVLTQYYNVLMEKHYANCRSYMVSYDDLVNDYRVDITLRGLARLAFSDEADQVDIENAKSLIRFRR